MTPLGVSLARLIEAQGPQSVAAYMALCMAHREHGYYGTRDPLGRAGDFVTAPEISQVFGELLGLALAQAWIELGRPAEVALVEVGPGRGTLMADALRALGDVAGFMDAAAVHLVETSAVLRQSQRQRLKGAVAAWHHELATIPHDRPLLLLANEFLDVLPVRQFVRTDRGWRERFVALGEAGELTFVVDGPPVPLSAGRGDILELSPAREAWIADLAARLARQGGMALLVDYGEETLRGDTLMAIRDHVEVDPLARPGEADLSTHVDWGSLARAAGTAGADVYGPITQQALLARLGIEARLRALLERSPERAQDLVAGVRRLVEPEAMGHRFKALALTAPGGPVPPGFLLQEKRPCS